ncbi:DUF3035 domain-containing protein [Telmatospirillum sp.]|uniref:DUF3035 domain-containing protein n=1 Tax=Telmatospirillum sp. TaxID=2079197 RepID=UPI00284A3BBE|nr:DUF3035 domain-containing protein [Telmatospirillum sp.]MDR3435897.1 DUF3035 domain-containing protein [Telmatospirillum sp.]
MTMVRLAAGVTLLAALSLTGCSEARRALGYDKSPPDEFAVMARAPLAQPPDFSLRPPMPGAPRPQEGTTRDQAKGLLVTGGRGALSAGGSSGLSAGEQALLSKAGADQVDPNVRRKVDEETTALVQASDSFTNQILFWKDTPQPGEPLDASQEAARLKASAAAGKPPAAGKPLIIRHDQGLFGLF